MYRSRSILCTFTRQIYLTRRSDFEYDIYTLDAEGNCILDAEGRQFTYDAENKQVEVENGSSQLIGQYRFDGDGKRVKKVVPNGETTIFVYDASGRLIGEYSTEVQPTQDAKTQYLTADHLGTPRINTNGVGSVVSRSDYMPYGEEITSGRSSGQGYVVDDVRKGFTGYEKDDETGLDYAMARMYSNALGRFSTTDPVGPDIYTPPSHNRYQYALNNPYRFVDRDGRYDEEVHRDLTVALAYAVGFSEAQATVIGNANQWIDDGPTNIPKTPVLTDTSPEFSIISQLKRPGIPTGQFLNRTFNEVDRKRLLPWEHLCIHSKIRSRTRDLILK